MRILIYFVFALEIFSLAAIPGELGAVWDSIQASKRRPQSFHEF